MMPFGRISSIATPLDRTNVDTDQIIPKQFLKSVERTGFGKNLFYGWRYRPDGSPASDFVLNNREYARSQILVAGENFGCGSSREHAAWAILDYGFRVVIAPSFADIFYNNCVKNSILPVQLAREPVLDILHAKTAHIEVDLAAQSVLMDMDGTKRSARFQIGAYAKKMLLDGLDEIAMTMEYDGRIGEYEQSGRIRAISTAP